PGLCDCLFAGHALVFVGTGPDGTCVDRGMVGAYLLGLALDCAAQCFVANRYCGIRFAFCVALRLGVSAGWGLSLAGSKAAARVATFIGSQWLLVGGDWVGVVVGGRRLGSTRFWGTHTEQCGHLCVGRYRVVVFVASLRWFESFCGGGGCLGCGLCLVA